jgi:hypothetical protein
MVAAAGTMMRAEPMVSAGREEVLGAIVLAGTGTVLGIVQCVNRTERPNVNNKTRELQGPAHRQQCVVTEDSIVPIALARNIRHTCSDRPQTRRKVHYDYYSKVNCLGDTDVRSSCAIRLSLSGRSDKLARESTYRSSFLAISILLTKSNVVCMLDDTWMQQKPLEATEPRQWVGRIQGQSGGRSCSF